MSYGKVYTLPFASLDGKKYEVKIERAGYTGKATELKGQPSPFTVNIDNEEFIYTPTRLSTATLAIFGEDYLQDLFSTDYKMHRVTLYCEETPVWCGFIKPELYTQDYSTEKFNLELSCYSAISVLEYVEYKQKGEYRGFVSLWEVLKNCIEESMGLYTAIYIPHVYGASKTDYENWSNPLEKMMISEQNFYDEDDNAMSLKEVLEEIMKLMNWTCVDWRGELYFIDVDNESREYYMYNSDLTTYSHVKADEMNVQEIGFAGSDHTLDILPGYNKASVKCSNYPVGEALPEIDFDDFMLIGAKENSIPNYTKIVTYRPISDNIHMNAFKVASEDVNKLILVMIDADEEKEMFEATESGFIIGAIPQKYDTIEKIDNEPARVDWEYKEQIYIPLARPGDPLRKLIYPEGGTTEIIKIKGASSTYLGGAFAINFSLRVELNFSDQIAKGYFDSQDFSFLLRIGNNYYHGNAEGNFIWDKNPEKDASFPNNLEIDWGDEAVTPGPESTLTSFDETYQLKTTRQLNDGYDGLNGYIIKMPEDRLLFGDFELIIYAPRIKIYHGTYSSPTAIYLDGFEVKYKKASDELKKDENSDRIYENIVNENYLNELDEIEFKISSYNNDGACYSKVTIGEDYLKNNLYCGIIEDNIRPEEFLIRRIVDHYSDTKIKLTQILKNADIKPYTILSDNYYVNKKYINAGGEIDYRKNRFSCVMIEI